MQCKVWVKGISSKCTSSMQSPDEMNFHVRHQWGMPDGVASAMCPEEDIGELNPLYLYFSDGDNPYGWYGYFKTEADAKRAVAAKIESESRALSSKLSKLSKLKSKIEHLL